MGAREIGANGKLDAKLWGLKDNQPIYFGIRAYDSDGHKSNWSRAGAGHAMGAQPERLDADARQQRAGQHQGRDRL